MLFDLVNVKLTGGNPSSISVCLLVFPSKGRKGKSSVSITRIVGHIQITIFDLNNSNTAS